MGENINLAFQGVWSHKLRSFLTMLGIIIGIAAIITIVSTIQGTNEQIKQNLIGAGNNVVRVQLMQDNYEADLLVDRERLRGKHRLQRLAVRRGRELSARRGLRGELWPRLYRRRL